MYKIISTQESISRILATPLGSRVMMPEYGSLLFELIDKTITDEWRLLAIRYIYEAIEKNEPRAIIDSVEIITGERVAIKLSYKEEGVYKVINIPFVEVADAIA